jgi:hypothetical protein
VHNRRKREIETKTDPNLENKNVGTGIGPTVNFFFYNKKEKFLNTATNSGSLPFCFKAWIRYGVGYRYNAELIQNPNPVSVFVIKEKIKSFGYGTDTDTGTDTIFL